MARRRTSQKLKKVLLSAVLLVAAIFAITLWDQMKSSFAVDMTDQGIVLRQGELDAVFLDIGQGDSILLYADNHAVLVDTGPPGSGEKLISDLKALGITRLDALIITHPHDDHIGNMDRVLEAFPTDAVYMPRVSSNTDSFEEAMQEVEKQGLSIQAPKPGQQVILSGMTLTFLHPPVGADYDEVNNTSLVVRVDAEGGRLLLTGDMEKLVEKELLEMQADVRADVLKAAHHGSNTSSSKDFLKAVGAGTAIISCDGVSYGHPHKDVLKRFKDRNMTVYRTDRQGSILCRITPQGIFMLVEKPLPTVSPTN